MDHIKFIGNVIEIYGEYKPEVLEDITMQYIKDRWKESELEFVFKKLILLKTTIYKDVKPPDPAEFEKLFPQISAVDIEAKAKSAYTEISRFSTMYPVVFSDICVQGAVELMGGWSQFNNYKLDEEQIHRNTFCKYYKQIAEDPGGITPKVLQGSGNWYKTPEPQLIGCKESCLQIVSSVKNQALKEIENMTEGMTSWQKKI